MKTQIAKHPPSFFALCGAALALGTLCSAQTPPALNLQPYAGLSITGAVGTVYSLQYITDLAQTNNASAWRSLEFLGLPASPYLRMDKSGPAMGRRSYWAMGILLPPGNTVFIPPGSFRIGSPPDEAGRYDWEGPQTDMTINRHSHTGTYELTRGEYLSVTGTNPNWFQGHRDQ